MNQLSGRFLLVILCFVAGPAATWGRDHFLTIAGGYSPTGNQVSLERNVEFFRRVLDSVRSDKPPHDVYFADGTDPHRDLQFRDTEFECPPARRIAMELFGDVDNINISYRNHHLQDIRGATSPAAIEARLNELAEQLQSGDRLFIYATAHGGASDDKNLPYNTKLYTWQRRSFTSSEFNRWLDRLPPDVPVILVMVQCYAGGFSHSIFNEGNEQQGLSDRPRCGFFSQVHDRMAAGCTPDVDEANYQEYSSFFWAALGGQSRLGEPIPHIDYDGNGVTTLSEAHAYAVIESDTVDIPLRTSDAFLQKYSRTTIAGDVTPPDPSQPVRLPPVDFVEIKGPLNSILLHADPIDRYVATTLAAKLKIDPAGEASQIENALEAARRGLQEAERKRARAASSHRRARQRVVAQVKREWPELEVNLSPMLAALMAEKSQEFVSTVERLASYRTMKGRADELKQTSDALLRAKKQDALARRFQQIVRRIVLAANLPKVASPDLVERYQSLIDLESTTLQPDSRKFPPGATPVRLGDPRQPIPAR